MKRILAVTGSPADWGLLDSVLQPLLDKIHLSLIVLDGHSIESVYETHDNVEICRYRETEFSLPMLGTAAQTAQALWHWKDWLGAEKFDGVLLLGDRVEIVTAAVCLKTLKVPIHHLYAGDRSGCVDDYYRDAISMLSTHLYAVSTEAWNRVADFRHTAPDRIKTTDLVRPDMPLDPSEVPDHPYAVACWHPETMGKDDDSIEQLIAQTMSRAVRERIDLYIFPPNKDDGWELIHQAVEDGIRRWPSFIHWAKRHTRAQYLSLLQEARWIHGNSSSFILEAPLVCQDKEIYITGFRQAGRKGSPPSLSLPLMSDVLYQRLTS